MEFQKSMIEVIKSRRSSRTYDGRQIDVTALQKLTDYIAEINQEKKIKGKFLVVQNDSKKVGKTKQLGTYGVISGANSFLIGMIDKDEKDAVTFGYLFEKIVLYATHLGIQTCWLGGTFKKSNFEHNVILQDNEFIPIVSPIGYKKGNPRVFEAAMRTVIQADKRKAWSELFFEKDSNTPLDKDSVGLYNVPLEMVRLGPSASNKQPWRIVQDKDGFHFFLCRTKGYALTAFDMQKNDIGIAKCHFKLSANELQLKGSWQKYNNINVPAGWEYIVTWTPDKSH